jgi:hypothetical protein
MECTDAHEIQMLYHPPKCLMEKWRIYFQILDFSSSKSAVLTTIHFNINRWLQRKISGAVSSDE